MVTITCLNCGNTFQVTNARKDTAKFCCRACADEYKRKNQDLNCTCTQCGKKFHMKPYQINKYPRNMGFFCTKECETEYRKEWFKGENNHQYGLKGELNASFKRGLLTKRNHHLEEEWISCPDRPDLHKNSTRMTVHRYNVVTNPDKYASCLFSKVGDYYILKDNLHVHHIDLDHKNNDLSNLTILSQHIHTKVHNQIKELAVELTSKIIGVLKQGELLETPEVDNQQPSLDSNILEGSETNNRVLTDSAEDSNVDTSALLHQITKLMSDYIVQTKQITKDGYEQTIKEYESLESEIKSSEEIQNGL